MAKRWYYRDGVVHWLDEGHRHREDGPASVWPDGTQYWYRHGWYHFAHGPSVLYTGGQLGWYDKGELLRWSHPYG